MDFDEFKAKPFTIEAYASGIPADPEDKDSEDLVIEENLSTLESKVFHRSYTEYILGERYLMAGTRELDGLVQIMKYLPSVLALTYPHNIIDFLDDEEVNMSKYVLDIIGFNSFSEMARRVKRTDDE